ncbi:MAG: acyl-CoA thioesterase [Steroidobacteraceae bacterium]
MQFDHPHPHVIALGVEPADIDAYEHVNNAIYLTWLDRAAWSHSAALGVPLERCIAMRRGMAALRTEIDYLLAAVRGDAVQVATWIARSDGRLRCERRFQVVRPADGRTLARAVTEYVCINLDSRHATRMPQLFALAYVVTPGAKAIFPVD